VRWRLVDLARWFWKEYRVVISKQTLSGEMCGMGYRKLSARPRPDECHFETDIACST
jgi:hypothetical protein